jgi:alpha-tubulin suppressor-like RCC1 family protein
MEIICVGSNFYGQLGIGDVVRPGPSTMHMYGHSEGSVLPHDQVRDVQCGSLVTVVLDMNGQIQVAGSVNGIVMKVLRPVELMYPLKATQVACGSKHILALLDGGYVCSWGTGYFGQLGHGDDSSWDHPRLIGALEPNRLGGTRVRQVACGGSHSGVVTENNRIFMWGLNRNSQCGVSASHRREGSDTVLEPRLTDLSGLQGDAPATLVCGRSHSAAVGVSGRVYTWGAASFGRLGQMDARKKELVPKEVPFFHSRPVHSLAIGEFHSLALTRDCSVYSWGYNPDGQCGHGNTCNLRTPRKIEALSGLQVVQVTCGASWSNAVTKSGELYTWGYAEGGWTGIHPPKRMPFVEPDSGNMASAAVHACSFDSKHNILVPMRVPIAANRRVTRVRCGGGHSIIFQRPAAPEEMRRADDATSESMQADSDGGGKADHNFGESDEESLDGVRPSVTTIGGVGSAGGRAGGSGGGVAHTTLQDMSSAQMEEALLSWVRHKKVPEVALALSRGVNVEVTDEFGNTPLLVAVQNGHTALVTMLIDKGARVNCANLKGNTPLHYAFAYHHEDIGRTLVGARADEYALNTDGLTPYEGLQSSDLP